jgi:hypothetical protein
VVVAAAVLVCIVSLVGLILALALALILAL